MADNIPVALPYQTFKGHHNSVISLDLSHDTSISDFASSSEDGSVCLWKFQSKKPTLTIKYEYMELPVDASPENTGVVQFHSSNSNRLFVSNNEFLLDFDLRKAVAPVGMLQTEECINHFRVHPTENILAAPLDSGRVVAIPINEGLYDIQNKLEHYYCEKAHTNLCHCVSFKTGGADKSPIVFSGGFDCSIIQHNLKTLRSEKPIKFERQDDNESNTHIANPPFITGLQCKDNWLGFCNGSGEVGFYQLSKTRVTTKQQTKTTTTNYDYYLAKHPLYTHQLHGSAVVAFELFNFASRLTGTTIASIGNDKTLCITTAQVRAKKSVFKTSSSLPSFKKLISLKPNCLKLDHTQESCLIATTGDTIERYSFQ